MSVSNQDILCESYLKIIYQNAKVNFNANSISETYGEILPVGIDKLLSEISLTKSDTFFDLGSGLGKLAIQVFLKSNAKEVCGVELMPELHEQALAASDKICHDLPAFYAGNRKLTFLLGSFLEISLTSATVILAASPCFTPNIMRTLERIVEDTPGIHSVLTMRPMHGLKRLQFKKAIRIECSWDSALCYLYTS